MSRAELEVGMVQNGRDCVFSFVFVFCVLRVKNVADWWELQAQLSQTAGGVFCDRHRQLNGLRVNSPTGCTTQLNPSHLYLCQKKTISPYLCQKHSPPPTICGKTLFVHCNTSHLRLQVVTACNARATNNV